MSEIRRFAFENLEVYKVARELVIDVYRLQNKFPMEEKFALGVTRFEGRPHLLHQILQRVQGVTR